MRTSISLEEALEILNNNVEKNDVEEVSILQGAKRIIEQNVYSKINNPPFNKSAMDGYAIKIDENKEQSYKVIGTVYAGDVFSGEVKEKEAVKIMTGAKIPVGANAVVKKEDVKTEKEYISLSKDIKIDENICFKGEDIYENQLLISKGKELNFADIGILASSGISKILVYKKAKIGFLTTGDEIVDIDKNLEDGKIYNSNKYSILARLYEIASSCDCIEHSKDDIVELSDKIKVLSEKVDLIITTGGASVGDKDLLQEAIEYINGENLFKKINIKPGSAVLASKYNNTIIISLSGNPTAALTTFELLVKPIIERLNGKEDNSIKIEKAILLEDFNKKVLQRRFFRGKYIMKDEKQYVYMTQTKSGNGILSSTIDSNCIVELKKGTENLKKGDKVSIIKL
ncbi:MAG: molybdopterin molybdotransferase MoeA [Paraclostridium sp.]